MGRNLCKALIKKNYEILGYDVFDTSNWSGCNFEHLRVRSLSYSPQEKLDVIFHLGMPSSSPIYKNDRRRIYDAIKTTIDVFELAIKNNCPVVYASSSSLYNGNRPPFKESMKVYNTDWYTETRHFIERLALRYYDYHDVKSVGLRIFSCYGPGDAAKGKYANVVTQFTLDMIAGKSPLVYGDGKQSRDFIHVDDVVNAFLKAAKYHRTDVFNVGTGEAHSFNDSIDLINKTLGTKIKTKYTENQIHNYVFSTLADIEKTKNVLKFEAKKEFKTEFPKYVKYLKEMVKDAG